MLIFEVVRFGQFLGAQEGGIGGREIGPRGSQIEPRIGSRFPIPCRVSVGDGTL
jgi:hypothetical protein